MNLSVKSTEQASLFKIVFCYYKLAKLFIRNSLDMNGQILRYDFLTCNLCSLQYAGKTIVSTAQTDQHVTSMLCWLKINKLKSSGETFEGFQTKSNNFQNVAYTANAFSMLWRCCITKMGTFAPGLKKL